MGSVATAAVTPFGVRDGDPVALSGLVERRGSAVLAYAGHVAPEQALETASDAFGRFRATVVAADDPLAIHPERELLRSVRSAAAQRVPRPARTGRIGRRPQHCALVPELLVARAEGTLTPADTDRLARHVERCRACRALEHRFEQGERAYRAAPDGPPPLSTSKRLMEALFAAAPVPALALAGEPDSEDVEEVEATTPETAPEAQAPTMAVVAAPATAEETIAAPPVDPDESHDDGFDEHDEPVPLALAAPAHGDARRPRFVLGVLVPAVVVAAALVVALAVAGVFSGDAPSAEQAVQPVADPTRATTVPAAATTPARPAAKKRDARKAKAAPARKKRVNDEPSPAAVLPAATKTTTAAPPGTSPNRTPAAPVPQRVATPTPQPTRQASAPAPKQTVSVGSPAEKALPPTSASAGGTKGFQPGG